MTEFYTHFFPHKNHILVRGYDVAGKRFAKRVPYKPYMFVEDPNGQYNTLGSKTRARKVTFNNLFEGRKFVSQSKDVSGFKLWGLERFEYVYINDKYPTVDYNRKLLSISNIDIEVHSNKYHTTPNRKLKIRKSEQSEATLYDLEKFKNTHQVFDEEQQQWVDISSSCYVKEGGFPHANQAEFPITAITVKNKGKYYVFGCRPFKNPDPKNIYYFKCKSEKDLLYRFIKIWIELDSDVVTGWNINGFDIPYLVNRITSVYNKDVAALLSPWKMIDKRTFTNTFGKEQVEFNLVGVAILDYLQLYKKFTYVQQQNYRLDTIAEIEIGENKLDYSEVHSLLQLYKTNFQKYIDYNIHDVNLVDRLDEKLKLIDLAFAVAYDVKINFQDVFTTVSPWDVAIHNHLLNTKKTVIPQRESSSQDSTERVPGAHVKSPLRGLQKWIVSVDIVSDYPRNMMQWNISPETYVGKIDNFPTVDQIVRDEKIPDPGGDYAVAGNGCLYRKDVQGVLGELIGHLFDGRAEYKKQMIKYKNENEIKPSESLKNLISKFDNLQQAAKIRLNSLYGGQANESFRYFSVNNASAVTTNGVLIIKWAEKKINQWLNKRIGTTNVDYVIAIDTDSLYFSVDGIVREHCKGMTDDDICHFIDQLCNSDIVPYINDCFVQLAKLMNAYSTDKIVMKREVIGSLGFWVAKKRYAIKVNNNEGVQFKHPKIKIMGGEAIRSSTPTACKKAITKAIGIILNESNPALIAFIKQFRDEFDKLPFNEIAFPRSVSDLSKYEDSSKIYAKGTPLHVKGALLYNHHLFKKELDKKYPMLYDGDKLLYCYLNMPNPINDKVISVAYIMPEELNILPYLDRQTQFEKAFLEPLKKMTATFGWSVVKQNTITSFFKKKAA